MTIMTNIPHLLPHQLPGLHQTDEDLNHGSHVETHRSGDREWEDVGSNVDQTHSDTHGY